MLGDWVTWLGQVAGEWQHHPSTHLLTPGSMLVPQRDRPMEVWVLTRMLTRHVPLTRHWSSLPLTLSSAEGGTRMPITRGLGEESASWGATGRNGCLRLGSASHLSTKGIRWEDPSESHEKRIWVPSLLLYFSPSHTPLAMASHLCFSLCLSVSFFPSSHRLSVLLWTQDPEWPPQLLLVMLAQAPTEKNQNFLYQLYIWDGQNPAGTAWVRVLGEGLRGHGPRGQQAFNRPLSPRQCVYCQDLIEFFELLSVQCFYKRDTVPWSRISFHPYSSPLREALLPPFF